MPEGGGGGRAARAGRYPPLASLVVSTIAAFSAVIVIAVIHSVWPGPLFLRFLDSCRIELSVFYLD